MLRKFFAGFVVKRETPPSGVSIWPWTTRQDRRWRRTCALVPKCRASRGMSLKASCAAPMTTCSGAIAWDRRCRPQNNPTAGRQPPAGPGSGSVCFDKRWDVGRPGRNSQP